MRKRAPLLDLGGDKFAAKRWIPWAQRQLDRLKLLVGGDPINRLLRPVNGTLVHIRSVGGNDFIRIEVAQGGEYSCEFPTVFTCPDNCSDFQLRCWSPHNAVGFWMRTPLGYWDNYHWDFGDGNTLDGDQSTAWSISHEYDAPGTYTVSVTASINPTITTRGSEPDMNDALHKIGIHNAYPGIDDVAWAAYLASSGITSDDGCEYIASTQRDWRDKQMYKYESQEQDIDIDLTTVNPEATVTLIIRVARLDQAVHYPNYGDPPVTVANGEVGCLSNLGVFAKPVIGGVWEDLELGDLTPFIGTVKNVTVVPSPSGRLPQYMGGLPVPGFAPVASNRIGMLGGGHPYGRVSTPGESMTTTKVIKVNSGRPKKTRQIGESIHT
jgi:hypothetical protein